MEVLARIRRGPGGELKGDSEPVDRREEAAVIDAVSCPFTLARNKTCPTSSTGPIYAKRQKNNYFDNGMIRTCAPEGN